MMQKINRTIIIMWSVIAFYVAVFLVLACTSAFDQQKVPGSLIYILLISLPLLIIGILATIRFLRGQSTRRTMLLTWLVLITVILISAWLVNFESHDFSHYLAEWCASYRNYGWRESFRHITTVSNNVPLYNYFLIFCGNIWGTQGCLYAIKYLSFIFSIILACVMELLVCHFRQTKFNYLHLALFVILPPVLLEFTAWGQSDAIYVTFALLAFYFALKHKSVPCFISLGLAFAVKLQFLFIVPIIFVMLIIRDQDGKKYLSWKWVWIAPLMYVLNLLPVCFGANAFDLLMVYFSQASSTFWFSEGCFNLPYIFFPISYFSETETVLIRVMNWSMAIIGTTITIIMIVLVLRARGRRVFTDLDLVRYALLFAMVMVYFMPKMHERFYFIAFALSMVYCLIQDNPKTKLLCMTISAAFSLVFYNYLIPCAINPWKNYFACGLIVLAIIMGMCLMTTAVICLIKPVIQDEIKAHEKLTKADN